MSYTRSVLQMLPEPRRTRRSAQTRAAKRHGKVKTYPQSRFMGGPGLSGLLRLNVPNKLGPLQV